MEGYQEGQHSRDTRTSESLSTLHSDLLWGLLGRVVVNLWFLMVLTLSRLAVAPRSEGL